MTRYHNAGKGAGKRQVKGRQRSVIQIGGAKVQDGRQAQGQGRQKGQSWDKLENRKLGKTGARGKSLRAMRVRSHSMETMVGSHRHRSPGVGGGVPASLSGGGLPQSTECTKSTFTPPVLSAKSPLKSPVKRRSGLFPRLHSSTESPSDRHTRSDQKTPDICPLGQEGRSETWSNPSSPEICPNKERPFLKLKDCSSRPNISRSSSSTSSFSSTTGEGEALEELDTGTHPSIASSSVFSPYPSLSVESQGSATPLIMCRSPTDVKSKMSPRSNLKFRFDKMSHATTVIMFDRGRTMIPSTTLPWKLPVCYSNSISMTE
ncbi:unnamed protein product [Oncorhynchus mykiss]|uniref:Uncharacterized protein n=1 Tax=Oncorhynchus mykiss TaxID=8022 RepID=A0A060VV60_ONCMY|nr:unnamed protein product [Oncorhynchus mykiss]